MRLPLSLIIDSIKDTIEDIPENLLSDNRLISRPVFSATAGSSNKNMLLLCESFVGALFEKLDENSIVICTDIAAKEMAQDHPILFSRSDIRDLSDRLHALFDKYESWVSSLNEIVLQHGSLNELLDVTEQITGNPISVMGENYFIVAVSSKVETAVFSGKLTPPIYQREPLPDETINSFKNNPVFLQSFSETEPFYYIDDFLPSRVICSNIFYNDSYCARIIMSETEQELNPWDYFLMQILTEYIQMFFLNAPELFLSVSNDPNILLALIHREPVAPRELETLYSANSWQPEDRFQMVVVRGSQQDSDNNTTEYYVHRIRREYTGCIAASHDNEIYILYNRSKWGFSLQSNARFSVFIREANFRVGISSDFSDLNNCIYFFEQARAALDYGIKLEPTIWIHSFRTYAFRYLIEHGSEKIPLVFLRAQEMEQLENYDQIHGSELYDTLAVFLRCNQNATQAADILHIQRRSLYFRLKKIREMTGLNFEDFEKISYLRVSLLIRELDKTDRKNI